MAVKVLALRSRRDDPAPDGEGEGEEDGDADRQADGDDGFLGHLGHFSSFFSLCFLFPWMSCLIVDRELSEQRIRFIRQVGKCGNCVVVESNGSGQLWQDELSRLGVLFTFCLGIQVPSDASSWTEGLFEKRRPCLVPDEQEERQCDATLF